MARVCPRENATMSAVGDEQVGDGTDANPGSGVDQSSLRGLRTEAEWEALSPGEVDALGDQDATGLAPSGGDDRVS
jgi:hypothetical protein